MKFKILVASLALQQIKEVGVVTTQEDITVECTCKIQWHTILMLSLSLLGLMIFCSTHAKSKIVQMTLLLYHS